MQIIFSMKRYFLIILILISSSFVSFAQFHKYYSPYAYAAAAAEVDETQKLNNIRFDARALADNPEVWANYRSYLDRQSKYLKQSKPYEIVFWSGLGVACTGLIPLFVQMDYDYDDPRSDAALGWSIGLLSAGSVATIVGYCGMAVQLERIKDNKKEFIYYLKTSNNGVGIVTIF